MGNAIGSADPPQLFLCWGESYLSSEAGQTVIQTFTDHHEITVHSIDGLTTPVEQLRVKLFTRSLLPGIQLFRVSPCNFFQTRQHASDLWEKSVAAHQSGNEKETVRALRQFVSFIPPLDDPAALVLSQISADLWREWFGFAHPGGEIGWADQIVRQAAGKKTSSTAGADAAFAASIEKGLPPGVVVVFVAEHVDKRKKLFTIVKKHGEIIDCSIPEGSRTPDKKEQKTVFFETAQRTCTRLKKNIDQNTIEALYNLIGNHPAALAVELEKIALYLGDRISIIKEDVILLVGRTREDAIFELSEALVKGDMAKTLTIYHHLRGDGIHSLAVIAMLRNFIRKLLAVRALQMIAEPVWRRRMSYGEFTNHYLPALKDKAGGGEYLKGHPFGLLQNFLIAENLSITSLKEALRMILSADYKLKRSPVSDMLIVEELLISLHALLTGARRNRTRRIH